MALNALLKITQGPNTDVAGRAVKGTLTDGTVLWENGSATDVETYKFQVLDVPPGSALPKTVQGPSTTPTLTTPQPDVPGSYRVQITITDEFGNEDIDIRNLIVPFPNGFLAPPYQGNPRPRPIVGAGAKPDELNIGGQPRGWMGDEDPTRKMMHQAIAALGADGGGADPLIQYVYWVGVTDPVPDTPNGKASAPFQTVAAAATAAALLPGGSIVTYLLTGGAYAESPAFPGNILNCVRSTCGISTLQAVTVNTDGGAFLLLDDVACDSVGIIGGGTAALTLRGKGGYVGDISASDATSGSIYQENVESNNINAPTCSWKGLNAKVSGSAMTVADCSGAFGVTFGAASPEATLALLFATMTGEMRNCSFVAGSGTSFTTGGTLNADDASVASFFKYASQFVDATEWIHLDFSTVNYTPVLDTTNHDASIGNGFISGAYLINGNTVQLVIDINIGSTTDFGTGDTLLAMPPGWIADDLVGSGFDHATMVSTADGYPQFVPYRYDANGVEFYTNLGGLGPILLDGDFTLKLTVPVKLAPP